MRIFCLDILLLVFNYLGTTNCVACCLWTGQQRRRCSTSSTRSLSSCCHLRRVSSFGFRVESRTWRRRAAAVRARSSEGWKATAEGSVVSNGFRSGRIFDCSGSHEIHQRRKRWIEGACFKGDVWRVVFAISRVIWKAFDCTELHCMRTSVLWYFLLFWILLILVHLLFLLFLLKMTI